MALITWRDEYNTGDPAVDAEHKELIALINALHDKLQSSEKTREEVADFLGEIHHKVAAHFALEERLMREKDYEDFAEHKQDHDALLDAIRDIMDDYDEGAYDTFEDVLSRHLDDWFCVHFRTRDAKLHRILGSSHGR